MKKPFTIGILREITDQYESGDISYAKMVEMLNEIAIKWQPPISKMETTQTAVDWFYQRILAKDIKEVFKQAKAMEKEQMRKCASFWRGKENEIEKPIFEQYYNETYGSNNQI